MNYRNSIENTIRTLSELDAGEEIIMILRNFANYDLSVSNNQNLSSIEDQLKDLRNRCDKGFGESTMNLFPAKNEKGVCHSFCLGIANKKFDKPRKGLDSGFKGIMTEMIAYWFDCLNTNKKTLILTSTWDNEIFVGNFKKIIDVYTKIHNKQVFIIEVGPTGFFPRYPY
jgi:hypothetical protein